jgi:hypothetical protein
MEGVTLPIPPEGYKYKLVRDKGRGPRVKDKDPSELTPRQKSDLAYREKNRERLLAERRQRYQDKISKK